MFWCADYLKKVQKRTCAISRTRYLTDSVISVPAREQSGIEYYSGDLPDLDFFNSGEYSARRHFLTHTRKLETWWE